MEVVNMYKCGICGHIFEHDYEATHCECSHKEFENISLEWSSVDCNKYFPKIVKIQFTGYPTPVTYQVRN